eukprot:Skav233680  [mRNA]  locus=scaffold1927:97821:98804:- [translate_table: standard]
MQSLLRLNITCLTTNGKEGRKLRVVLSNSNTVQQLLHKIESHPECQGKFKELRLMDGAYLHSQDVLQDVLKESERDLEALPAESERDDNRRLVDIVQQDYIANRRFREDKHCNYLSCAAGDKMVVRGHANGWFYCVNESGAAGYLPEWVFEESDASEAECTEPVDHMAVSSGYRPGLGVVDRICAMTSGYVDSITFHMHDGRQFSYGHGGDRAAEVLLGRDETIQSVTQIEKQSLGEIVVTTSKRELEFKGYFGRGKHFKRHFFECRPGQQVHHLEMQGSVLSGIHEVQISRGEKRQRSQGHRGGHTGGRTGDRHQRIRLRSNSAQR